MKQFILVAIVLLSTACGANWQSYDAQPIVSGERSASTGEYGPLSEDELPECFTIVHKWGDNGFDGGHYESLGEYCRD